MLAERPELTVREATILSMGQIQMALVAIALVLCAVFLPMMFFGGSTGVIYRQFSATIVAAMGLSVFIALSLSPALAATVLRRTNAAPDTPQAEKSAFMRRLHSARERFNFEFQRLIHWYSLTVSRAVDRKLLLLICEWTCF